MPDPSEQIAKKIDALIHRYRAYIHDDAEYGESFRGSDSTAQEAQSRITAAIHRYTLPGDAYRAELDRLHAQNATPGWRVVPLMGLLTALRDDYRDGNMATVQERIHADLFSDFLEMSEDLQTHGFKDAAAVITGSVLEEQLRKLADVAGIATANADGKPLKAEAINTSLVPAVYDKNEQKQVTAWLGIRNSAAHGQYGITTTARSRS